jgi:putative transposase
MPNYIRPKSPGATVFFTVALADRGSDLLTRHVDALREAVASVRSEQPFVIDAWVVLPDHLHAVWTLPEADRDFSTRWKDIKARFTKSIGLVGRRSASKLAKGEAGLWQRRFWDHHIRDEADFAAHVRYCWGNPVKHGYVERAVDWPFSSIHRDIRLGRVDAEWSGVVPDGDYGE